MFAHELGHAVQARVGYNPSATVYFEQQADCFAGAWAQHVADSDDANVHLSRATSTPRSPDLLTLSDPSGIDGGQDGAHGNGFDRVSAFQDGYEGGAQACADYQNNPPAVTETGYTSSQDQATGGNLPARRDDDDRHEEPGRRTGPRSRRSSPPRRSTAGAASTPATARDGGVLTDAVIYDPSTNTVHYDAATLQNVHDSIGDFAGGLLLATAWSSSVEHQLGVAARHRRRPPRRRVPGRRVGGGQRVVAVAR